MEEEKSKSEKTMDTVKKISRLGGGIKRVNMHLYCGDNSKKKNLYNFEGLKRLCNPHGR